MFNRFYYYAQLIRLDKPIGILLLLWPTLAALWLATPSTPSLKLILIFSLGVIFTRSAGCAINDYADRNIDRHVSRTQMRPLAAKLIQPREALFIFIGLLILSLLLVVMLNSLCFIIAVIAAPLIILYPFCKRYTYLPQFVLGVVFNLGILMAFASVQNTLTLTAWLFYNAGLMWTIAYDTIYALSDKIEDEKIGVKSTAILFGSYDQIIIGILQGIFLILLLIIGYLQSLKLIYYGGLIIIGLLFVYQQRLIAKRKPESYHQAFLNNHWIGLVLWLSIALN
ncbi:MAG: 4-hydroxybenzoate octaprenyltransferase [Legionellales bacterium]|nr:4-hydroxybenzoate octaprenyltransferase [Legionellales bacterium]